MSLADRLAFTEAKQKNLHLSSRMMFGLLTARRTSSLAEYFRAKFILNWEAQWRWHTTCQSPFDLSGISRPRCSQWIFSNCLPHFDKTPCGWLAGMLQRARPCDQETDGHASWNLLFPWMAFWSLWREDHQDRQPSLEDSPQWVLQETEAHQHPEGSTSIPTTSHQWWKKPPYVLYLELCNGRALKLLPGYKLPLACWLAMSPMLPQPLCKRPTRSWGYAKENNDVGLEYRPLSASKDNITFIAFSDASFACRSDLSSQGGYLVAMVDKTVAKGEQGHYNVLGWRSWKLARVSLSTLAAESQAASEAADSLLFTRTFWNLIWRPWLPLANLNTPKMKEEPHLIVDAKALYDLLSKPEVQANSGFRQTHNNRSTCHTRQVSLLWLHYQMGLQRTTVRWWPHQTKCCTTSGRPFADTHGEVEKWYNFPSCQEEKPTREKAHSRDVCCEATWKSYGGDVRYVLERLHCSHEDLRTTFNNQLPLHRPQLGHDRAVLFTAILAFVLGNFWCMASRLHHGLGGDVPLMAWLKRKTSKRRICQPRGQLELRPSSTWRRSWTWPITSERSTEWIQSLWKEESTTWRSRTTEERSYRSNRPLCPGNPMKRWGFTARRRKLRRSERAAENFVRSHRILCTSVGAVEFGTLTRGAHLGSRIKVSKVEDTAPCAPLTF